MKIREYLFKGFDGCTDGNCIINGKTKGMHTNGGCKCLERLSRLQMNILSARISAIAEKDIEVGR